MNKVEIKVNNKQVPLNQFVTTLTAKLVMAIVDSLKGIEEKDVHNVSIKISND